MKRLLTFRAWICLMLLWTPVPALSLGLLVPAYFYPAPGGRWSELNQAASRVPLIAIMNPNNGPAGAANPDFAAAVGALRNSGGTVIGYVYSSYTARPIAQVKADVDRYNSFYLIDGIFVDEMTNDSDGAHLAYYQELYQYIKAKQSTYVVWGNPGTTTQAAYLNLPAVDALVTFESNTGYAGYVPDAWTRTHPPTDFGHLCYDVASAITMTNDLQLAVNRNAGFIYVTDDLGGNPWDTLPTYWSGEVGFVETLNQRAATNQPPRLTATQPSEGSVQINLSGVAGRYFLQTTTDFTTWQTLSTNVSATGMIVFPIQPTTGPARYYRAVE